MRKSRRKSHPINDLPEQLPPDPPDRITAGPRVDFREQRTLHHGQLRHPSVRPHADEQRAVLGDRAWLRHARDLRPDERCPLHQHLRTFHTRLEPRLAEKSLEHAGDRFRLSFVAERPRLAPLVTHVLPPSALNTPSSTRDRLSRVNARGISSSRGTHRIVCPSPFAALASSSASTRAARRRSSSANGSSSSNSGCAPARVRNVAASSRRSAIDTVRCCPADPTSRRSPPPTE